MIADNFDFAPVLLLTEDLTIPDVKGKPPIRLATTLSHSNPEAISEMKKMFWKGTDHWDELLKERAAISRRLVLSGFSKIVIEKFKAK